jgi:NTE family protein
MCPGNYVMELMGKLIADKTGNPDYTLEDLYKDKNITLVIVATNMSEKKSVYFYPGNPVAKFSNIPIRKAIRMSMGIPFLFEPCVYEGDLFVDGGLLDSYPLHVFDGEYPGDPKARLNLCIPNSRVLGIKIMTSSGKLDYDLVGRETYNHLHNYAISFIETMLIENERRIMTPSFWDRTIVIVTPDFALTKSDVSEQEKIDLIECGKACAKSFLDKRQNIMATI